jgi:hypothetical protein
VRRFAIVGALAVATLMVVGIAGASTPGTDARLTNDNSSYVSVYTLATGTPYTDQTLAECSISRGRQNEPAVAVDPRNTNVLLGSSNDYCGVYNRGALAGAVGPVWLGYYRSQSAGTSWTSSLVPGYPDDASPYAQLSQARTAGAGDPVIAWDAHGRAFFGSESSGDPAATAKTFGDVWVARFANPGGPDAADTTRDGLAYGGTTVIAHGSSAPGLLGVFHDKTSIEADRTGGRCDGNVYFAWARFSAAKNSNIYLSRSTDHGVTFSNPQLLTSEVKNVQDPSIAVTGNGNVYVTWDQGSTNSNQTEGVGVVKSTDCGAHFGGARLLVGYTGYAAQDVSTPEPIPMPQSQLDDPLFEDESAPGSLARDCGDFADACESGYTFFRRATNTQATADEYDTSHEWIYVVYDASKGPVLDTGTTYGTISTGKAAQTAAYFVRYNGATGAVDVGPKLLDNQALGHQVFPDISADGGVLHAFWWDTRDDSCYSPIRPIGNCANRTTVPALDVFGTTSTNQGLSWATPVKLTDTKSNGNFEQFDNRAVPFGGDYLTITGFADFAFGTWTDWRDTVPGTDPRETPEDEDAATADVVQCRVVLSSTDKKGNTTKSWSGDRCPHAGGLDQNIYGDKSP